MGSAALLMLLILGIAYIIRLDLDPLILGKSQPFSTTIEKLIFYPLLIALLLWTYYGKWEWPEEPPDGLYLNKFTLGIGAILVLILGRAIVHFIHTERDRWDFFDQLPFYMMIQFQFFVPLVYYYQLERNGLMPKEELGFSLACMFICYGIVRWLIGRSTFIPRNPVAPWVALFIAYMLLTVIFMPYRLAAVKNVIQWIAFASCFIVGLAYIPDRRRRDIVLITFVVAALVSTLWGFWKYFDIPNNVFGMTAGIYPEDHALAGQDYFYKTPSAGRYFLLAGFFANPNYYGEYLALTLFIGLGLLLYTDSKNLRLFLSIAVAINAFEMVALYNRAGWLGIFTGIGFVLIFALLARVKITRRVTKLGIAISIAVLIMVLFLTGAIFNRRETDESPLSFTPWERLKSMTDFTSDETFRNRLTMWRAAYLMVKDEEAFPQRLIFGGGFGFFEVEYLPYQTEVLETYNFNDWFHNVIPTFRAHNDHIQMLVEAGVIGTALYALIFIMFFIYGFRYIRDEKNAAKRLYALGIIGATASILATAFFSFPLHKIQHGGLIFAAMGILVAEIAMANRMRDKAASQETEEVSLQATTKKKKKKRRKIAEKKTVSEPTTHPDEYYIRWRKKIAPEVAYPLIAITLILTLWGVYTQIINLKSQYFVVKGITALRNIDSESSDERKAYVGQIAAGFFWRAYQLDPTNGRAEFFHGFALTKKNTYEDVVAGTEHLEEGQLLYPQSDTFYALAMGYEARRNLAQEHADATRNQISVLEGDLERAPTDDEREAIRAEIDELNIQLAEYGADVSYSQQKAIDSYMTAAQYYPVKVEYYKELLRLLEEEGRYADMIFWAERALVVDDWLLKKPPIRWQLYLWLGRSHRALSATDMQEGNYEQAVEHLEAAEEALLAGIELSRAVYYTYYELGQVYEALGDYALSQGDSSEAVTQYEDARDMYVQTFNYKDNVRRGEAPFDYAYMLLGRIYEKLGDPERAVFYYDGLLTQSLYSRNSQNYQVARERIYTLTGEWHGQPPAEQPGP